MSEIYLDGKYLQNNQSWHQEDSAWKALQIEKIISKNISTISSIAEIGCGAGRILAELSKKELLNNAQFQGYDISPQAIDLSRQVESDKVCFKCEDLLAETNISYFDLLLVIDVFEHVPDYMGFLNKCRAKAKYKIYHVPLDLHVSSVFRNTLIGSRYDIGHLHYFTADSAIATIQDTGHTIIDHFYTNVSFDLYDLHPSVKTWIANIPRSIVSKFDLPLTARLFGGYSLLVLAE
jgi:SAM-dependent methyltransferase